MINEVISLETNVVVEICGEIPEGKLPFEG
jgi:hypothetical protein